MAQTTTRARVPFSANRSKLQVDRPIKGHQLRWFNDDTGRIQRAQDAGWVFVDPKETGQIGDKEVHGGNSDVNSKVSRIVGKDSQGAPMRAYLMKIRDEFYNEDLAKKAEVNNRVDEAIRGGKAGGAAIDNSYGKVTLDNNVPA